MLFGTYFLLLSMSSFCWSYCLAERSACRSWTWPEDLKRVNDRENLLGKLLPASDDGLRLRHSRHHTWWIIRYGQNCAQTPRSHFLLVLCHDCQMYSMKPNWSSCLDAFSVDLIASSQNLVVGLHLLHTNFQFTMNIIFRTNGTFFLYSPLRRSIAFRGSVTWVVNASAKSMWSWAEFDIEDKISE